MLGRQGKSITPNFSAQSLVEAETNTLICRVNAVVNEWELGGAWVIEEDVRGILKKKVRSTGFSCRELGRGSPGKGTEEKRGIRHWQPLGTTNKFYFSWSYNKVPDHKRPYATMFGFYFDVIFGKHLKGFVPASDIIKYVTEKNFLNQFSRLYSTVLFWFLLVTH